jgi:DNA-binding NarL/FixJ family response regulator
LLRESVATLEPSPARLEHARALIRLGTGLRVRGQRREAREPLAQALDIAHRCGASVLVEQAQAELIANGARPRRKALTGPEALTPSELRAARMAANGLTNREIAQALFLSTKTVDSHLSRTYEKLGIHSRQALADALAPDDSPKVRVGT